MARKFAPVFKRKRLYNLEFFMKILSVSQLSIPEVLVIRCARFLDQRGYFTEPFRKSDLTSHLQLSFFTNNPFVQINESCSKKYVIRGLHFQWNPYMGKLVRTVYGHMIDIVLDIRLGSPTFGKAISYDMPHNIENGYFEWIWIPPGFAHGNCFLEETTIEYLCTGEYSQGNEVGISPFSKDIDWSLCPARIKKGFDRIVKQAIVSEKDLVGINLKQWEHDIRSHSFTYTGLLAKFS